MWTRLKDVGSNLYLITAKYHNFSNSDKVAFVRLFQTMLTESLFRICSYLCTLYTLQFTVYESEFFPEILYPLWVVEHTNWYCPSPKRQRWLRWGTLPPKQQADRWTHFLGLKNKNGIRVWRKILSKSRISRICHTADLAKN